MAKGRRATQTPGTPWMRWVLVLVGLVVVGSVVWLVARPSGEETLEQATAQEGEGPQPLDVSDGPTIDEASIANVPPESLVAAGPEAPRGVVISNDPRVGAADAPVTIVEFSDFQCPHCADFHTNTFPALRSLYGDRVRWFFVNRFYTQPHPHAEAAAIAAECANRQGRFWEYAEQVFERQSELGPDLLVQIADQLGLDRTAFDQCRQDPATRQEVTEDLREADRLDIGGTPTFIVNGQRILGAQPLGVFNEVIQPYFR